MRFFTWFLYILLFNSSGLAKTIAFIGDSISTGAGTRTEFEYGTRFWDILEARTPLPLQHHPILNRFSVQDTPVAPQVLWPTPREFQGPIEWVGLHLKRGLSNWFLNEPTYSWGYMLGRSLGYEANNILLAAENGSKIETLPIQIDRILHHTQGVLPDKTFIFYTGNDLCAPHVNLMTPTHTFSDELESGLHYYIRNSKIPDTGSDIYIVAVAAIQQIVSSDAILNRPVKAFGMEMTCRQLREESYRPSGWLQSQNNLSDMALILKDFVPPNPAILCPTLFSKPSLMEDSLATISGRIRSYRKAGEDAANLLDQWAETHNKNIKIHWISSPSQMNFEPQHVADDCFHLSLEGQAYLAETIGKHLASK